MIDAIVAQTNLDAFPISKRGKVRDLYDVGDHYLIVSTDRLSAFDVVFNEPIPYKGAVLNQLSAHWFKQTSDIVPNHFLSTDIIEELPILIPHRKKLEYRSMLVKKAEVLPFECIVRGYLMGSAYEEYKKTGAILANLMDMDWFWVLNFHEPLFTPSTKSDTGHDVNVSYDYLTDALGRSSLQQIA
jgi:phosphoribosylaminoimidazole-succinocarboxamide synthase